MKRFLVFAFIAATSLTVFNQGASALSGSEFQAGRIADDAIFYNSTSMNSGSIQALLNSKVPTCDTFGSKAYGSTTRAAYSASKGYPAPYTCLKNYTQDTPTKRADKYCSQYTGGVKSASGIIADVAQACGINPKVLIILLEKEQSLITDDWPWPIQYRSATGYGCPDTAPCDAEYYGFFNQVYNAARQFKRYNIDSALFRYRAYRDNYIQYNPNAGCGGSNVYIRNQTTASLYNYTPYQPNASALNNLYGTGDSCGAYGNRNFWRMYNDWFGSTLGDGFNSSFHSMNATPSVYPGQQAPMFIQYRNIGSWDWKDDTSTFPGYRPVHLAITGPINRASWFSTTGWLNQGRPAGTFARVYEADGTTLAADQHTVQPGQIGRFEFNISVPHGSPAGLYRDDIQPVLEGSPTWVMGGYGFMSINVLPFKFDSSFHSMSPTPSLKVGQSSAMFIQYKNTGSAPWKDDTSTFHGYYPVHLAITGPINSESQLASPGWLNKGRPAGTFARVYEADGTTLAADQHTVQPGQIGRFEFNVSIPAGTTIGVHKNDIQPVVEGAPTWIMGSYGFMSVNVIP